MIDKVRHIEHLLTEQVAGSRVLVIGDLMLDRYLWGEVDRISPEAPIPVVKLARTTEIPGGAANVALNLAGLGVSVMLAGFIGRDSAGDRLAGLLESSGIGIRPVCRADGMPTVVKSRVIVQRNQMLRLDEEDPAALSAICCSELQALVCREIDEGPDAVVISDYAKGVVSEELVAAVVEACGRKDVPLVIDPKGTDYRKYRGATIITPNFKEFCAAAGKSVRDEKELLQAARTMRDQLEVDTVVVTRGEKGITAVGEQECTVPAATREVFDVSGAGDTVAAVLAVASIAGLQLEEALKLANLAAGVVIGKVGTVAITASELVTAVYRAEAMDSADKLCGADELAEKAAVWHDGNLRVGLASGCIGSLGAEHVELLERLRSRCDRLIVVVCAQQGVSSGEVEVGRILAGLHCVDAVAVVGSGELGGIIDSIGPEILEKDALGLIA